MSAAPHGPLSVVGAPHALPVIALSRSEQQAKHAPGTLAHWAQIKRWPRDLAQKIALLASMDAARVLSEAEAQELAHAAHAGTHTVSWWGLQKKWPAWLVAAMAAQRHSNETLTEDEAHALAERTAGLSLGRK